MKKKIFSIFLAVALLFYLLPQMVLRVNATEPQKGDGWGNWSDYVLEETVVIYPVQGGNVYLGQMNPEWLDVDKTKIELLCADSTVTRVQIPETINGLTVSGVSEGAFSNCTYLKSVDLPATIEFVWGSCFIGCTSLEEIIIEDGDSGCYTVDGVLYAKGFNDWTNTEILSLELYPAAKKDSEFAVPHGVTSISYWAFGDATNLRSISIPESVRDIQSNAFGDWYSNVNFTDIYYEGSETQWKEVLVGSDYGYDAIESTLIHFNRYEPFVKSIGEDSAWNSLYYDYIVQDRANADSSEDWEWVTYELVYLNNDNIPELWITYQYWASGCRLVTIDKSSINEELLSMGSLSYNERNNAFFHSGGKMDVYFDTVFKLEDGALITVAEGQSEVTWSSDGTSYSTRYFWNDSNVTEAEYTGKLNEQVNESTRKQTSSEQSTLYDYDGILDYLSTVDITSDEKTTGNESGLLIYSDYTNLSIRKGSTITLSTGILVDGELTEDVSGITFQIEDTSVLSVSTTNIKDNCRYVKLKGLVEGTTSVVFNDSNTGYTAKVPVTVYDDNYLSYTLNSVPTQNIEKYPTNVYNVNGLYIDSFKYTVNDDQSATVSFDVYNTNYTYGVAEVFDENGNMKDAVLIEKMSSSNTSIKEALWDNIGYLVRDIIDGDLLSYRQESGYTKRTSVSVKIPQNGYIKICTDPENSLIVGLVNSVDGLMSMASLAGDIKDFDVNSKEFSKKLTTKLLTDQVYVELIKDGSDASKDLWKNIGKETFITSKSMGSFTDTITKNIDELKLGSIIADTASDFGWDVGENVFTYFAGPAGTALNVMFTIGKVENLIIQQNDLIQSAGVGSIYIQNQGGGIRSCQQIKVESEDDFDTDTALNVFTVTLDAALLDVINALNPDAYEAMTNGITYTYNISLLKNGNETQPDGKVTVYIPIPEDLKFLVYAGEVVGEITGKVKIYRVEEDGSLTEMDAEIEDGCFVFTTDHFSLYTIVGYDSGEDTIQNKDGNGISTFAIIGIVSVVIAGMGAIVIIRRKKK